MIRDIVSFINTVIIDDYDSLATIEKL